MYQVINRGFRSRGLSLRVEAAKLLHTHLLQVGGVGDDEELLGDIVRLVKDRVGSTTKIVDADTIQAVLAPPVASSSTASSSSFKKQQPRQQQSPLRVVDAFATPKLEYDKVRKTFVRATVPLALHAGAESKIELLRHRYALGLQRARRHFSRPSLLSVDEEEIHITEPGSLLGKSGEQVVFGILSQLQEGSLCIEDLNSSVPIELEHDVRVLPGMFTENALVLAQGHVDDGVFKVRELVFPPVEERTETLKAYPVFELFGLPEFKPGDRDDLNQVAATLDENEHMMVVLSDVWLDKPTVMKKLRDMFSEFNKMAPPPPVFVLAGNFTSVDCTHESNQVTTISGYFDALASMLAKCKNLLRHSHFVFVPGPHDPGFGATLPRPGLPHVYTQKLRSTLTNVTFASNPCRLLYYAHEMVFFREDLLHKLRRNCLFDPVLSGNDRDVSKHLALTLTNQAHLCTLPLMKCPIYWDYDYAMSIYPLPDALVVCDQYKQYEWRAEEVGCDTFNPGQFGTDYSFVVYSPCKQTRRQRRRRAMVDEGEEEDDDDDDGVSSSRVEFSRVSNI